MPVATGLHSPLGESCRSDISSTPNSTPNSLSMQNNHTPGPEDMHLMPPFPHGLPPGMLNGAGPRFMQVSPLQKLDVENSPQNRSRSILSLMPSQQQQQQQQAPPGDLLAQQQYQEAQDAAAAQYYKLGSENEQGYLAGPQDENMLMGYNPYEPPPQNHVNSGPPSSPYASNEAPPIFRGPVGFPQGGMGPPPPHMHMQQQHSSVMGPPPALSPGFSQGFPPPPPGHHMVHGGHPGQVGLVNHNQSPFPRRPPPSGLPPPHQLPPGHPMALAFAPEYRIHEMNKRLQQRVENCDNQWWDSFATEFFEDDSRLIIRMEVEGDPATSPPRQYMIGRSLIPRFFRTYFEGGVVELQFEVRLARESFHNGSVVLDCDNAAQVTVHTRPTFGKVFAEGRLIVHFGGDELMRIRSWFFHIRQCSEFIQRHLLTLQLDPMVIEQHAKNLTVNGLHAATLNFLKLCVILEPMQELMARHKSFPGQQPMDCLTGILFDKWRSTIAPQVLHHAPPANIPIAQLADAHSAETARATTKRRKRKTSSTGRGGANNVSNGPIGGGGGGATGNSILLPASKKSKNSHVQPVTPCMPLASQDVMIVGEPTLMGGDFGDEDERVISRLENSQYDPLAAANAQVQAQPRPPPNPESMDPGGGHFVSSTGSSPRGPPSVPGAWPAGQPRPSSTNGSEKTRSPNS